MTSKDFIRIIINKYLNKLNKDKQQKSNLSITGRISPNYSQ